MILSTEKLLKLVKEKNLVEGLSERELHSPEGAGFDLRLGEIFELSGSGFLGQAERKTPKEKQVAKFYPGKTSVFLFKPGKYYVVKTIETVNLPSNLLALITPRSTLYRSGIVFMDGNTSPGYRGGLSFGFINFHSRSFKVELGARIAHIMFFEVKGKTLVPYRGQWQGGRVSARKKEKQI